MAELYGRVARLIVARPLEGSFFQTEPNATVITDLDISFDIEKQLGKEPNKGQITIYNLAPETRAEFEKPRLFVRLDAGYNGDFKRVFQGDIRRAKSVHEDTEWMTTLEVGDGERAYRFARLNKSFAAGVKQSQLVREAVNSLGAQLVTGGFDLDSLNKEYPAGAVLFGSAHDELTRILGPEGVGWSIQDGKVQILDRKSTTGIAFLLNQETGVIRDPEFGTPSNPKEAPRLTVNSLLKPEISPGALLKIQTRTAAGLFKAERVRHVGSVRGQTFQTTTEALPL